MRHKRKHAGSAFSLSKYHPFSLAGIGPWFFQLEIRRPRLTAFRGDFPIAKASSHSRNSRHRRLENPPAWGSEQHGRLGYKAFGSVQAVKPSRFPAALYSGR